jgi:hypothetical protein
MLPEKVVGQIEDLLELSIPCNQVLRFIEHRHAIAHFLEGDTQLILPLPDFVQQSRVLHRDHRLRGEALQQGDLLIGKNPNFLSIDRKEANNLVIFEKWHIEHRSSATKFNHSSGTRLAPEVIFLGHPIQSLVGPPRS